MVGVRPGRGWGNTDPASQAFPGLPPAERSSAGPPLPSWPPRGRIGRNRGPKNGGLYKRRDKVKWATHTSGFSPQKHQALFRPRIAVSGLSRGLFHFQEVPDSG